MLDLLQQALEGGDPGEVLSALLLPSSGVEDVVPANASRYLHLLTHTQRLKAQVCVINPRAQMCYLLGGTCVCVIYLWLVWSRLKK